MLLLSVLLQYCCRSPALGGVCNNLWSVFEVFCSGNSQLLFKVVLIFVVRFPKYFFLKTAIFTIYILKYSIEKYVADSEWQARMPSISGRMLFICIHSSWITLLISDQKWSWWSRQNFKSTPAATQDRWRKLGWLLSKIPTVWINFSVIGTKTNFFIENKD